MINAPWILYCHCAFAQVISGEVKQAVLRKLCESGGSFVAVPDLCELSAWRDQLLSALQSVGLRKVAACHPRAVKWLLASGANSSSASPPGVVNLRVGSPEEALAALLSAAGAPSPAAEMRADPAPEEVNQGSPLWVVCEGPDGAALGGERRYELVSHLLERGLAVACGPELAAEKLERKGPWLVLTRTFGHWPPAAASLANGPERQFLDISALEAAEIAEAALQFQKRFTPRPPQQKATWFPVIDYGRCTNCLQCLSFCLFGVYDVDDQQRLRVQHPENCKNNCPACARVCPEVAVVFPKHSASPINGAEVTEADLRQEKIKVDLSALLGGDVYTLLRQRSQRAKARFSKERNADQALQERQRCLAALGRLGDIPPEVLMSLPSPEEIQRRVEEAKARAQAAAAKEPTSRT